MNVPNLDSYLDPDRHDPALQDGPDEDIVTCDQCEWPVADKDAYSVPGGVLCESCYHASVERTPGDDDAELDGILERAES